MFRRNSKKRSLRRNSKKRSLRIKSKQEGGVRLNRWLKFTNSDLEKIIKETFIEKKDSIENVEDFIIAFSHKLQDYLVKNKYFRNNSNLTDEKNLELITKSLEKEGLFVKENKKLQALGIMSGLTIGILGLLDSSINKEKHYWKKSVYPSGFTRKDYVVDRRSFLTNRKIHTDVWGNPSDIIQDTENALSFGMLLITVGTAMDLFEDNKKINRIVKHLTNAWNSNLNPISKNINYKKTKQKVVKKILLNLSKKHVPRKFKKDFKKF